MKRCILLLAILILLSGCSIKQTIEPAELNDDAVICIVEDHKVRNSFLEALKKVLDEKQVSYRIVDNVASKECEWKATYTARWSWDVALYMAYAKISVYKDGKLDGEAIYDATQGQGNMNKFIDAEGKVRELVNALMMNK